MKRAEQCLPAAVPLKLIHAAQVGDDPLQGAVALAAVLYQEEVTVTSRGLNAKEHIISFVAPRFLGYCLFLRNYYYDSCTANPVKG